jgi:anti-sigma-K factor RskA
VLGLASPEERAEFEKMCETYPEVKNARDAFEQLLEKQAMDNAVNPPPGLKKKIEHDLRAEAKVIAMKSGSYSRYRWLQVAVAACVVLLAGALYWNLTLHNQKKELNRQLAVAIKDNDTLRKIGGMVSDPQFRMVRLAGQPESPISSATIYWDTTSHDVYMMVKNLPMPPSDKKYQLWAILNGEPIDMGLLEISEKPLQLYSMKNVRSAQAFAITLEKKGGSEKPLGKMYVKGNL